MTEEKDLGKFLRQLRASRCMTVEEVMAKSGLSDTCIQAAEHGKSVRKSTLLKLAEAYEVMPSALLEEANMNEPEVI